MSLTVSIHDYCDNARSRVSACGTDNVSSIVDKLIRIAAKVTEYYASDVVFYINDLNKAVEERQEMDVVLVFREGGVSMMERSCILNDPSCYAGTISDGIQFWCLKRTKLENGTFDTELKRVSVYLR